MTEPSLAFTSLDVRRMPGFPQRGFAVTDLSPGINVIYGPNASGKTTLADAIAALLWPEDAAPPLASLKGQLKVENRMWSIDLDAGRVSYQCDGVESSPPALPSGATRDRYSLSLPELLQDSSTSFAETILRESAGGYDVNAAREQLGFRATASRATKELKTYKDARRHLEEARSDQNALVQDERQLLELHSQREAAALAEQSAELLARALHLAEVRAHLEAADQELRSFPDGLSLLTGEEKERLAQLRQRLRELKNQQREVLREIHHSQQELSSCALPDAGVPEALLLMLRALLRELENLEVTIRTQEQDHRGSERRCQEELQTIRPALSDDALAKFDALSMEALADFAHRAEDLRAEVKALEAQRRWLGEVAQSADPAPLRRGTRQLLRWLRENAGRPTTPLFVKILATGTALLVAAGTWVIATQVNPWWLLVLGVPSLLLPLLWWPRRVGASARREFEELGLASPGRWEAAEVGDRAEDLLEQWALGVLEEERARRRSELDEKRHELEPQRRDLGHQREQLVKRYGVAPELDEVQLYWLANRISRWQDAARQVSSDAAELATAQVQRSELLDRIHNELRPFGYERPAHGAETAASVAELEARRQKQISAQLNLRVAEEKQGDLRRALEETDTEYRRLFERVGLESGDEETLFTWVGQRQAYLRARQSLEFAKRDLNAASDGV
ncbi:MAG: AAA family ATPase, partial [Planctomycetota bacterium]